MRCFTALAKHQWNVLIFHYFMPCKSSKSTLWTLTSVHGPLVPQSNIRSEAVCCLFNILWKFMQAEKLEALFGLRFWAYGALSLSSGMKQENWYWHETSETKFQFWQIARRWVTLTLIGRKRASSLLLLIETTGIESWTIHYFLKLIYTCIPLSLGQYTNNWKKFALT